MQNKEESIKNLYSEESKSHTMGLRLDDEMYQQLIESAHNLNLKKSQVIKQAIHDWIMFRMDVIEENLILIEKSFLRKLLDSVDVDKIDELAEFSARNIGNKMRFKLMEHDKSISLLHFLNIFQQTVESPGFSWFNKLQYKILDDETVLLFGNHSLNERFSLYVKLLLKSIMIEEFKYSLIEQKVRISENTVHLAFKPVSK